MIAAIAPFTQTLTFAVAALAMVSIGMSKKRLEWHQRKPIDRRRRHWPWQKPV